MSSPKEKGRGKPHPLDLLSFVTVTGSQAKSIAIRISSHFEEHVNPSCRTKAHKDGNHRYRDWFQAVACM